MSPAGRPTDYDDEILAKTLEYLEKHKLLGDPVPTVEGLADELGSTKKTLYTWGEIHPEFLHALERLKTKQGRLLQAGGLGAAFQPMITKLMLSANHGMAEKNETDVTSGGEKIKGFTVDLVHETTHQNPSGVREDL